MDLGGRDVLVVFLKRPRPGEVKTRLIPALGAEAAAGLYRRLTEEQLRRTTPLGAEYMRVLFHAPASAAAEIGAWFPGERLHPQGGGDLGQRMAEAFETVFRGGARRAALVGTDVPLVTREEVAGALASLDGADVALGPAEDGGYYLIGLSRPRPGLFRGIPWSTGSVLSLTLDRARELALEARLLARHRDIDDIADLRAEWPRLRPILERDPALLAHIERSLAAGQAPAG